VLVPPAGRAVHLPPLADGKRFKSASLLVTRSAVMLSQNEAEVDWVLPEGAAWDRLDTVIRLSG